MVFPPEPQLARKLTVYDFKHGPVAIVFEDGESTATLYDAFYRREGAWTVVYTEHFGYLTFLSASIVSIKGPTRKGPCAKSVRYWRMMREGSTEARKA